MTDIPEWCEHCSCPKAPNKIDLCNMSNQNVLQNIISWFEQVCFIETNYSGYNIKLSDVLENEDCQSYGGTAGLYKNGYGYINGKQVQWQVFTSTLSGKNEWLYYYSWCDNVTQKYYVRLANNSGGSNHGGGLLLVFETYQEAKQVLINAQCINF